MAGVPLIANFDVTDDGQVDIEDVCEVEAAFLAEELPCDPTGVGDPSFGPCADYPGGECSTTRDLNRDTLLDEDDLSLIERRVGMSCDGSPVSP